MSVNAVNGNVLAQQSEQLTNNQSAQANPKQQNDMPQDSVTISSAAQAMQKSVSGTDVDHDGDSK